MKIPQTMVFTLHRYILWELLKVFGLATVALTLMLSLGSLLRPLQDYGVGPEQIIKLLSYFVPITLTFVLPIAALFAASLVYGRFACDNELDACKASGVGLWTLIYPALVLAILVAIANLFLSFYVVPNYVQRAEKAVKADAKQILFRNLQRKGSYELPGGSRSYRIHADAVHPERNELEGVVVAEVKSKQAKKIITARQAVVNIEPQKNITQVKITAYDAHQFDEQNQAYFKTLSLGGELGSSLADQIKFKEIDEMKRIRNDPMRFYPVSKIANQAYLQLAAEMLAAEISEKLRTGSEVQLQSDATLIRFTADSCKTNKDAQTELNGNVVVAEYDAKKKSSQPSYTYKSSSAVIEVQNGPAGLSIEMNITGTPEWTRPDGAKGWSSQHIIRSLDLPSDLRQKLGTDVLGTIATMPTLLKQPSADLIRLQSRLNREIYTDLRDIDIEINSRLVFGIACVSLILIGAGLGIIFKGGHLLTAFGASAIPAAVLIVCIVMGRNLADRFGFTGILLMWGALVILAMMTTVIYRKLLKN
jgi:lipopolysaccharide export LptBFGC system permease protein LptF